ncbi:hypothetical protein BDZ94DRAFT_1225323 [Collybia nuda]|uniref:Zinc finger PHD-type domain-containing protein n=1 Tax=Collybia nuda TaxID=64659 RepID=A0A9P6CB31_9AGAR|nr:hypothetical protein BDZ94DRAFT_1225323 [Collybia nuda]
MTYSINSEKTKYTTDSKIVCPDCSEEVQVGTGGERNLDIHRSSRGCKTASKRIALWKPRTHPDQPLHAFFQPKAAIIPSTVSEPPPIHAPVVELRLACPELEQTTWPDDLGILKPCREGVQWLEILRAKMDYVWADIPQATSDNRLACFGGHPAAHTGPESKDWELVIEAGDLVMACKVPGCETVWFHQACMDHDFAPRNWSCPSCKATGTTGKHRRT